MTDADPKPTGVKRALLSAQLGVPVSDGQPAKRRVPLVPVEPAPPAARAAGGAASPPAPLAAGAAAELRAAALAAASDDDFAGMLAHAEQGLALDPADLELRMLRARGLHGLGRRREAAAAAESALRGLRLLEVGAPLRCEHEARWAARLDAYQAELAPSAPSTEPRAAGGGGGGDRGDRGAPPSAARRPALFPLARARNEEGEGESSDGELDVAALRALDDDARQQLVDALAAAEAELDSSLEEVELVRARASRCASALVFRAPRECVRVRVCGVCVCAACVSSRVAFGSSSLARACRPFGSSSLAMACRPFGACSLGATPAARARERCASVMRPGSRTGPDWTGSGRARTAPSSAPRESPTAARACRRSPASIPLLPLTPLLPSARALALSLSRSLARSLALSLFRPSVIAQENLAERRSEIVAELAETLGLAAESAEVQAAASAEIEILEEMHHGTVRARRATALNSETDRWLRRPREAERGTERGTHSLLTS
jgi:hypothetical protein